MKRCIVIFILLFVLFSCKHNGSMVEGDKTDTLSYARFLKIEVMGDSKYVTIINPWDTTKILSSYLLVPIKSDVPDVVPKSAKILRTPLQKAVVFSSVHCALLADLNAVNSIGGICDKEYISNKAIKDGLASGKIIDVGNSMSPDVEKIIDLNAGAILLSPFENGGGYGRLETLGIPIVECADYMETTPLGRMEWIKFYADLFGCRSEADSVFSKVEKRYLALCDLTSSITKKPKLMCDLMLGSTWYVAGGNSYMAKFFDDAGADYLWGDLDKTGSVPLNFELVFDRAADADVWIVKYGAVTHLTYSSLETMYQPYSRFKAFKDHNIFACNTTYSPYYEQVPFHPDVYLEELIGILHPGVVDNKESVFFSPLSD